ncbi:hypothetical protein Aspvir_001962 [Aspergillus viridinutans]|uniref:PPPDE domain-containing protein n=1 Tax=Aspergillus viridinutans TaxID=75553 RepID=A0A9P3C1V3_ASPVI|nr:uncharacterized protein Aspvir_001962 [Aspergillus viridinutans]GIK06315.1 hypothetical protein Aspvir_001962 [Aspergillus viridinutans]
MENINESTQTNDRPIHLIFSSSSVILHVPGCPRFLKPFIQKYAPHCTRHWGVRVGDDVWDLFKYSGYVDFSVRSWEDVEGRYNSEVFVGKTEASNESITAIANDLKSAYPAYDAFGDNCQHFAIGLCRRIPKNRKVEDITGRGAILASEFHVFMGEFEGMNRDFIHPMQAKDTIRAAKALLHSTVLTQMRYSTYFLEPIIYLLFEFFRNYVSSAVAWFAELAEILTPEGWVLLHNGAPFRRHISSVSFGSASIAFRGVVDIITQVAVSPWNFWQRYSSTDAQLLRVGINVLREGSAASVSQPDANTVLRVHIPEAGNAVDNIQGPDEGPDEEVIDRRRSVRRVVDFVDPA